MNVNSDLLNLNSKSPAFSIVIEGKDVTTVLDTRLMSLTLTDNRGFEADQLDLEAGRRRRADRPAATWGCDSAGAGLERPAAFP
ncbi:phage late control D family protein [Salmonella bongori]|nr:phage late control D family protein [Salmonella bongori]